MISADDLAPSLDGLLGRGETPFFASSMVAGASRRATALSPMLRLLVRRRWQRRGETTATDTTSAGLPEAGVVVLTDARLLIFDGGRRGATLTPILGDLAIAVERQEVLSMAYDNSGLGWQTLTFNLDDGRSLPVAVPKRDVGQWLEQFPSPSGDSELA